MMKAKHGQPDFHILTLLLLGLSAGLWCILETRFLMPLIWMAFMSVFFIWTNRDEWCRLLRRMFHIGLTLLFISLLQIVFRRDGDILFSIGRFPLVYERGLTEAALLWIRYMVLFMSAALFLRKSAFQIIVFFNRIGFSMRFCFLLLAAFRMIPSIFEEARRVWFYLRFRGIRIRSLPVRQRIEAFRQFSFALLMRSMETVFFTAYGLEARGFMASGSGRIPVRFSLHSADSGIIVLTMALNTAGLWLRIAAPFTG